MMVTMAFYPTLRGLLWMLVLLVVVRNPSPVSSFQYHGVMPRHERSCQPSTAVYRQLQASSQFVSDSEESSSSSSEICSTISSRRAALCRLSTLTLLEGFTSTVAPRPSQALVTDETDKYADNWWSGDPATSPFQEKSTARPQVSDEFVIVAPKDKVKQGLGLELAEVEFRTNRRVYVKSVSPGSLAESLGIKKDWIVVAVNGQSAERTDVAGVAILVSKAVRGPGDEPLELRFRDPTIFQQAVSNLSSGGEVTTQVAPAGDTTQRNADGSIKRGESIRAQENQRLTVSQLVPPKLCNRGAQTDDLMEISYLGTVVETGQIFDGSAVEINGKGIPGRANDVSIFFVLGKQPFGQFPPGWDVGLVGMCVGERRRLLVPPVLAYGSTGMPRRGIPPNATLQYDVTLVSLNGLATPQ